MQETWNGGGVLWREKLKGARALVFFPFLGSWLPKRKLFSFRRTQERKGTSLRYLDRRRSHTSRWSVFGFCPWSSTTRIVTRTAEGRNGALK